MPDMDSNDSINVASPDATGFVPADGYNFDDVEEAPLALTINDPGSDDTAHLLSDMNLRLERIERTIDGMKDGVNTIGVMMNQVAEAFDQVMQKVNEGGIGALLGGFMGGKKNG